MINLLESLEDSSKFPGSQNYLRRYEEIKEYLDVNVHPFISLFVLKKEKIYLTKHGEEHVAKVKQIAESLISKYNDLNLTPYEQYLLLVAIQIHDSGHIISGRKDHEKVSKDVVRKVQEYLGTETVERKYIFDIAAAHGGKTQTGERDKIGLLKESDRLLRQEIRPRLLAAILRLSDELSDDVHRASKFNVSTLEPGSEIYHEYARVLHDVDFDSNGNSINLKFNLSKKQVENQYGKDGTFVFLIDEIYERVMKTYLETIYCQQFFPNSMTIHKVIAKIEFIEEESLNNFRDPISVVLSEGGYPDKSKYDIYEMCKSELVRNGEKIDGSYIKRETHNS